jgi:hypothetical protein
MAIRKRYFIQQFLQQEYLHGGVGCVDAERGLSSKGFESITFPYYYSFSLRAKISRFFFLLKTVRTIKKDSVVFFLFPVYAKMHKLLLSLLRSRNVRCICFIADIDGIKDGDEKLLQKEIAIFKKYKYFIVHNEKMKEWMLDNVSADCITASIEFFDFFAKPFDGERHSSFDVVFAGNLEKSSFLKKLHLLSAKDSFLHFHLYGPGQTESLPEQRNVTWHGIKKPYELPGKLNGSFGLLWDGDSIEKPAGSLGNYMQYISHHKLSLYILSKLPVIVPATAASAPLIDKYRIGFAVNSLVEIEDKIKNLSAAEYRQMQLNMQPLAEKISKGECLSNAIDEIMKLI